MSSELKSGKIYKVYKPWNVEFTPNIKWIRDECHKYAIGHLFLSISHDLMSWKPYYWFQYHSEYNELCLPQKLELSY